MPIEGQTRSYLCEALEFKGFIAYPDEKKPAPCVIVAHAWMGLDDFAKEKAKELASLGYVGFAADVYGDGITVSTAKEALELMTPLYLNRAKLRKRIIAALKAAREDPRVDSSRIGAIGFCFGGQTVLELLRSGEKISGVVSFHGVLGNTFQNQACQLEKNSDTIQGACLILHGHDDPLVSSKDQIALQQELTQMGIDWQFHIFGKTAHAFTNPQANDPEHGLHYQPTSAKRGWHLMKHFFNGVFQ
jgi:dienelactone hydrolase